jgi:hypothetical protein
VLHGRRRVPEASLVRWLESQTAAQTPPPPALKVVAGGRA